MTPLVDCKNGLGNNFSSITQIYFRKVLCITLLIPIGIHYKYKEKYIV